MKSSKNQTRSPHSMQTSTRPPSARSVPATIRRFLSVACAAYLVMALTAASNTLAQDDFDPTGFDQPGNLFGGISFGGLSDGQQESVTWSAQYAASGQQGRLEIEATVGRSWHIYSTTQPAGGPLPTKFSIASPSTVSVTGQFKPDDVPTKSVSDLYPGVTIEEHEGMVRWSAPIKIPAGFKGPIKVDVSALVCQTGGSCMPSDETLTATYAGPIKGDDDAVESSSTPKSKPLASKSASSLLADSAAKPTTFRDKDYEVTWTVGLSSSIAPGEQGQLIFRAKPEADYHVYQGVTDDAASSTNFVIIQKSGLLVGEPETDQPLLSSSLPAIPGVPAAPPIKYHKGQVTWSLPLKVPAESAPGSYDINGFVCYQACTDKSCLQPMAMEFSATVMVTDKTDLTVQPLQIKTARFATAIDKAAETDWVDDLDASTTQTKTVTPEPPKADSAFPTRSVSPESKTPERGAGAQGAGSQAVVPPESVGETDSLAATSAGKDTPKASLPFILLLALCGGFILNFMPCVLPVIGIKVLSFIQQAGEDRGRVAMLNFAYVGGILTVFAGLAVLAVVFSFGWGQQFAYFPVRIGLTVLIFALALSYLGVWELPTPGIATGKSSDELQKKEGLPGAFFTGAFATILATPCSGPFLGVALGYTLYLNSVESAAVIMTVGVGMSLPYILLGLFPSAVSILPKPGNWMVTLKEFMAFLFLGTVAFFFNQFDDEQKLPVFVTLIGVWFGCWVIGKVPPWETLAKRSRGWMVGLTSAAAIGWLGFYYLEEQVDKSSGTDAVRYVLDDHIRWEEFDQQRLEQHLADGKTVMLDFTAEWCASCKVNTAIALDTESTGELLKELNVVPMLADMTNWPEDLVNLIRNEFDSKSIPLLVIFPSASPNEPIILRDQLTESMVLTALKQAGPSADAASSSIAGKSGSIQRLTSANGSKSGAAAAQSH